VHHRCEGQSDEYVERNSTTLVGEWAHRWAAHCLRTDSCAGTSKTGSPSARAGDRRHGDPCPPIVPRPHETIPKLRRDPDITAQSPSRDRRETASFNQRISVGRALTRYARSAPSTPKRYVVVPRPPCAQTSPMRFGLSTKPVDGWGRASMKALDEIDAVHRSLRWVLSSSARTLRAHTRSSSLMSSGRSS